MRPLFLVPPAFLYAASLAAQVVDHTKVRRFAGEEITVRGPIARGAPVGGGVVWFSLGKPHPSASLVVVVPADMAGNFEDPRTYEGATVEVMGRIMTGEDGGIGTDPTIKRMLRGNEPKTPYIFLTSAARFKVVERPPAPAQPPPAAPTPPPGR